MNKGIFSSLDLEVNNNNFTSYKTIGPVLTENTLDSLPLGFSPRSTTITGHGNNGGTIINPSKGVGGSYIANGILPFSPKTNSTLDFDNALILVIDTARTCLNVNIAATQAIQNLTPHIVLGMGINYDKIDWGDGTFDVNGNLTLASHIYKKHGIYIIQIFLPPSNPNTFAGQYYAANNIRSDFVSGKLVGILSWPKFLTTLPPLQFVVNCDFVPVFLPTGVTSTNTLFQTPGIYKNIEKWDVSRLTTIQMGNNFQGDISHWVFNTGLTSFASMFFDNTSFNNGDPTPYTNGSFTNLRTYPGATTPGNKLNAWNTSNITNMNSMFYNSQHFNQNLSGWNVSKVTDFSSMFRSLYNTYYMFDGDLSGWQLVASGGITCANMFNADAINYGGRTKAFTGKGLNTWNTSGVTNMNAMFYNCNNFNQNLSGWNVSKVTNFSSMFYGCSSFDGNVSGWQLTASGVNCSNMFDGARIFSGSGLASWNTSGVTNMYYMFRACGMNTSISGWNTSNVTSFRAMFNSHNNSYTNNVGFNQDIGYWDTSKVTDMGFMFEANYYFNNGGSTSISGWNTSNVADMGFMFYGCPFDKPIQNWNTSKVTNMSSMFMLSQFKQNLDGWNVRKCTEFWRMFQNCAIGSLSGWAPGADTAGARCESMFAGSSFVGSGLDSWEVSGVNNMGSMFSSASRLGSGISLNLSNWNVSKCTNFISMFQSATNFNGNVSGWRLVATGVNGIDCTSMFQSASSFVGSGLNSWDTSGVKNMNSLFLSANKLGSGVNLNLGSWNVSNVEQMAGTFNGATSFSGYGIENWNIARLNTSTSLINFALGCTFPTGQYDLILNTWNTNKSSGINGVANWRTDLSPHFGSSKYTAAGSGARAALVSYGWTITDGGLQV